MGRRLDSYKHIFLHTGCGRAEPVYPRWYVEYRARLVSAEGGPRGAFISMSVLLVTLELLCVVQLQ